MVVIDGSKRDALSDRPDRREAIAEKPSPHRAAATSWVALAEHLQANSVLHEGSPRLADYALGDFNPRVVIERLLAPEPTYFAYKDILFAGLSAWTVAPHYPRLVKEAMILAGIARLAELESKRQKEFPSDALLADLVNRVVGPGIDFYRDFYYPAGGLQRIVDARSPSLMRRSLKAASKNIGFQVEMMRVCHFHAEHLQNRELFRKSSFNSGAEAVAKLIGAGAAPALESYQNKRRRESTRTIDALNCKKKSAPFNAAAALIYAADSIDLGSESLLASMCNGEATFKKHGNLLSEWLGRSVYTGKIIIEPMYERKSSRNQTAVLPSIELKKIDLPAFHGAATLIEDVFKTSKVRPQRGES